MAKIPESELIINNDGSVFHLHLRPEELADTVILVGDQGRVPMAASMMSDIEVQKQSREFNIVTGYYNGKRVTVMSTGIGTDNIDVVMTELDALANIDFNTREIKEEHKTLTILRIGTCGGLQGDMTLGEFVFSEVGIGSDGVLNWYADIDKINDKAIEEAFVKHFNWNKRLATPYFVHADSDLSDRFSGFRHGMTLSAPGFYGPQGRSIRIPLIYPDFVQKLRDFEYNGLKVTNIEMENSAIVGLSRHLGHKSATVCAVVANRFAQQASVDYYGRMKELIKVSLEKLTM